MPSKTKTIRQKITLPAPPDIIYDLLMDPVKHSEFTGSEAHGSSEVGGEFAAWDGYIIARNLDLEKGKRIVQEWSTSEWPEEMPPSHLEITLNKKDQGTELILVQTNVPAEQYDDYAQGWHDFYWKPMREYIKRIK